MEEKVEKVNRKRVMFSGKVTIQINGKEKAYEFKSELAMDRFIASVGGVAMNVQRNYFDSNQEIIQGNTGTVTINYNPK